MSLPMRGIIPQETSSWEFHLCVITVRGIIPQETSSWEFHLCVIARAWDHSPGDQLLPVQLLGTA